ncbi:MAG: DUF58 domain-containing protein [Actinobacteria bacterium]|nr:MAG: DUF58 domain-containing protein [Actinomycetota bacterium]
MSAAGAGTGARGVPRPAVSRAVAVLVLIGAAIFVIARTTGSGWLMVLLSGLVGVLAVSVVLPPLALRRARLEVRAPRDATAGRSLSVTVSVPVRVRNLRARLVEPEGSWFACDGPAEGETIAVPARRSVLREVAVDVTSAWPLGLVRWRRRVHIPLTRPVEVGPAPIDTEMTPPGARGSGADEQSAPGWRDGDVVRGAREYVPGDPVKLVHWPATARTGTLMVKELDAPHRPGVVLVVDLRGGGAAAETAAGRAAGIANAALAAGAPVTMCTAERGGPVGGRVDSPVEVSRRLARAVGGPPAEVAVAAGSAVVRVDACAV